MINDNEIEAENEKYISYRYDIDIDTNILNIKGILV